MKASIHAVKATAETIGAMFSIVAGVVCNGGLLVTVAEWDGRKWEDVKP